MSNENTLRINRECCRRYQAKKRAEKELLKKEDSSKLDDFIKSNLKPKKGEVIRFENGVRLPLLKKKEHTVVSARLEKTEAIAKFKAFNSKTLTKKELEDSKKRNGVYSYIYCQKTQKYYRLPQNG